MRKLGALYHYLILFLSTIVTLLPFVWMISTAFKKTSQVFKYPPEWVPSPFSVESFARIWEIMPFNTFILNTLFVTLMILVGQLIFSSMAAYGFARIEFSGRDFIFIVFLGSMMIPPVITMIPLYLIMKNLQWLDTYKAIIMPQFFGTAFGVFLLRQYFITIPKELEEAAKIDGCGIIRTFVSIILTNSKPILATLGVLVFVQSWNNFLWPLIVTNSPDKYMLSIGLANLQGQFTSDWPGVMAGALVALLPIIILYVFTQRYFVESIHLSGLK